MVMLKTASMSNVEALTAASGQIQEFIDVNHPMKVVVDFECVKFFSSQVLGMLLAIRSKLKKYDGQVVISGINPQLYRVFRITNLDKLFSFFPDKDLAVKAVGEN